MGASAAVRRKQPARAGAGDPEQYYSKIPHGVFIPRDSSGEPLATATAPIANLTEIQICILGAIWELQSEMARRGKPIPEIRHQQFAIWYNRTRENVEKSIKVLSDKGILQAERTKRGYRYRVASWDGLQDLQARLPRKLERKSAPLDVDAPQFLVQCPNCGKEVGKLVAGEFDPAEGTLLIPCSCTPTAAPKVPISPPTNGGGRSTTVAPAFLADRELGNRDVNSGSHHKSEHKAKVQHGAATAGHPAPGNHDVNSSSHHEGESRSAGVDHDVNSSSHHKAGSSGEEKAKAQQNTARAAAPLPADPWLAVKQRILGRIPDGAYRNWFAPVHTLDVLPDSIRVAVPNQETQVWLDEEYGDLIAGVLQELGLPGARVVYEVRFPVQGDPAQTAPAPDLRQRLEVMIPLSAVGEPLSDQLYKRIEKDMEGVPWECLRDVIRAKIRKIRSWAFISDHLVKDARLAWQRSGRR